VIIDQTSSDPLRILIGSAQGEVLSGDLLTILTDSIRLNHPSHKLLKFADDKFIVARVSNREDFDQYQGAVNSITDQLVALDLQVNDAKTKELVVDFTQNQRITNALPDTFVMGRQVERFSVLRMVGYELNNILTASNHVTDICTKANSKLFLMYKMASMHFPKDILMTFYQGAIRSPLEFAAPAFHHILTEKETKSMEKIQKRALRIITKTNQQKSDLTSTNEGVSTNMPSLADRRSDFCATFFDKLRSQSCPLIPPVKMVRNGSRISKENIRTSRYQTTFLPTQIDIFNSRNILNPVTKRRHSRFVPY
jgi:hypothetical protein